MKFTFTNTVTIQKPVSQVFQVASDPSQIPKWNYYVKEIKMNPDGTTFHQVRASDSQDVKILQIIPNTKLVLESVPPYKYFRREMAFEAAESEDATKIFDTWESEIAWPFAGVAASLMKKGVAQNLGKLKELVETGRTTLQDGRVQEL